MREKHRGFDSLSRLLDAEKPAKGAQEPLPFPRRNEKTTFGIADPNKVTDLAIAAPDPTYARNVQVEAEQRARFRYAGRSEMSVREWARVEDNKAQRDTVKRAPNAIHLHDYEPVHQFVNIARLPDGTLRKVDGHTRCYLWTTGRVTGPATVFADTYLCDDDQAVVDLYDRFDNQAAVENSSDKVSGAMSLHKIQPKSGYVKSGRFGTALKKLYRHRVKGGSWNKWTDAAMTRDAVGFYKAQIEFLDFIGPRPAFFPVGITMAVFASHKLHGSPVEDFWLNYALDAGSKGSEYMDPVQALHGEVGKARIKSKAEDSGYSLQNLLFSKAVLAVEKHLAKGNFKVGPHNGIRGEDEGLNKLYIRGPEGPVEVK